MEPAARDPRLNVDEGRPDGRPASDEDGTMGKYEWRIFLDRLVELRDIYRRTTPEATSITAQGAIDYATALFDDTDRLDSILAEESADAASTSDAAA